MRTTITLDSDVEALLHKLMAERGITFKDAVNSALRSALAGPPDVNFRTPTYDMGLPAVDLDRALALSASLEDVEVVQKMSAGR